MALDTNIALGIRPVEQPNMLAQMGQMMAIRQAQQGFESENALRDFYAKGGDLSTAEGKRQLMSRAPAAGMKLIGQQSEIRARDVGTLDKEYQNATFGLTNVTDEAGYYNWVQSSFNNPAIAAHQAQLGNTPEKALATARAMVGKEGLSTAIAKSAMGIGKYIERDLQSQNATRNAQIGAAAPLGQLALAREKYNYDLANPALERVDGENGIYLYNKRDPNSAVPLGMRPSAPPPVAPPAAAAAAPANNLLMTTQPTATNISALTGGAPNQAGPTIANAVAQTTAAAAQPTIIRPKQPIRQPVAVMIDGKAVLVPPEKAVGLPPATGDAEKSARLRAQQVQDLNLAISNLESITKPGGLISQSTGSGLGRAMDVSAGFFGQATEGAIAGAKLAPIADLVLKMVPRFEGPQSDKDTQSYKEAAGQLANTNLPVEIRRKAGQEVLRIMKARKDQFVSSAMNNEGLMLNSSAGGDADPLRIR